MAQDLVKIGKLTRLHGIKGAIVLNPDSGPGPDTRKTRTVFLEINEVPTPFFVSEIKPVGKNFVLILDSVNTTDEAKKLTGKAVWIEKKNLVKEKAQADYAGYNLVDSVKGDLGKIIEVVDMPGQRMFALLVNGKEVLLPVNEELIAKIDVTSGTVFYNAPDGLLDIYLG